MRCGWFFGSHGCDSEKGHGPLPTDDGGFVAHRCSAHDEMCCEIKPANEGETAWVLRYWWDDGWGSWDAYSAPFQLCDDGLPPQSAGPEASGALGLFTERSNG